MSISSLNSEENFSNYKKYNLTKTKFKLDIIAKDLHYPWALTFVDKNNLLVTEKKGGLFKINLKTGVRNKIKHGINHICYDGGSITSSQGGLLDAQFNNQDGYIYFTYSHDFKELRIDKKPKKSWATAIARGTLRNNEIIGLQVLLIAKPKLSTNKHFGSRISIKDGILFASFGERDQGMIAQDPTKHPGSIIRINTNGSIPKDNPKFNGKETWLPEIYTIGVRNPQGMALSPFNNKIYLTNHGAKGGDWFGVVKKGENYGWKILGWGGTNYIGTKIGPKWKPGFTKAINYWVPSIAASSMVIYKGNEFKEWNGDALITSLKDQSLRKIEFKNNNFLKEDIIC